MGVLQQIPEPGAIQKNTLLLGSQDEAGSCILLVTLHFIYPFIDAKPHFFSVRVEAVFYSRQLFNKFFLFSFP